MAVYLNQSQIALIRKTLAEMPNANGDYRRRIQVDRSYS
jgi:hypothetical protein